MILRLRALIVLVMLAAALSAPPAPLVPVHATNAPVILSPPVIAISALLARAAALKGIGQVITSVEELQNAYRKYWSEPANWWQAPSRWFDPTPADVGGIFTNKVNMASSHFRNLHMYRILAREALGGERVFAVVGSNHVPMQRRALECALADDSSREESSE